MSEYNEIEFKNSLTKEEFIKLVNYFNLSSKNSFEQLNIYFDTKDSLLFKNKMALRTRIRSTSIELTLKQKLNNSILETNEDITLDDLNKLLNDHILVNEEVYKKLKILNINNPFYEITRLKTIRYEFNYLNNIIALDKSIYYNHIDYELELETKNYDYGKKIFTEILNSLNIKRKKTKNKILRALEYKKSLKVRDFKY